MSARTYRLFDSTETGFLSGEPGQDELGDIARGTITLTGTPADQDLITISDGDIVNVFEFTSDGSIEVTSDVAVLLGGDIKALLNRLLLAINSATWTGAGTQEVRAFDVNPADKTIELRNPRLHADSNVVITETDTNGVIAFTGMAGALTKPWTSGDTVGKVHNLQKLRDEIGNCQVKIISGTAKLQIEGRIFGTDSGDDPTDVMPFTVLAVVDETDVDGTGTVLVPVRVFPQMRCRLVSAAGAPVLTVWLQE